MPLLGKVAQVTINREAHLMSQTRRSDSARFVRPSTTALADFFPKLLK